MRALRHGVKTLEDAAKNCWKHGMVYKTRRKRFRDLQVAAVIHTNLQTCAQPSWSNVVSLATQQHCSRFSQNAFMQMPSLRSNIQLVPMSMTAAQTPRIINTVCMIPQSNPQEPPVHTKERCEHRYCM